MNKQVDKNKDLEFFKRHEEKIKSYQVSNKAKQTETKYRHLAYKVKNPFRGV